MVHARPLRGPSACRGTVRRPRYRPALEELECRTVPAAGPFASPSFQAQFSELLRTFNVPQASLAVQRGNQTYTYWETNYDFFASRHQPVPVTGDSLFRVGSVSKIFAAAAVMTLVQAGSLELTDSAFTVLGYQAGQMVSGFDPMSPQTQLPAKALPDALFDVTVEELLRMTSGLPQNVPVESVSFPPPPGKTHLEEAVIYTAGSYAALAYAGTPVGTAPDFLPASLDQQLDYYLYQVAANPHLIGPPAQQYDYSDTGYAILGAIVEHLAQPLGLDYNDYLQTYVLGPMGIVPPSGVPVPNPAMIGLAHTLADQAYPTEVAYFDSESGPSVFPDPSSTNPPFYPPGSVPMPYGAWGYVESHFAEGGLTATPTALVRFFSNVGQVSAGEGTGPLTQQTITQMLEEPPLGKDLPGGTGWFGLGWAVYPPTATSKGHWYKNGAIPGSSAEIFRYEDGTVWAVTFNSNVFSDGSGSTAPHTQVPFAAQLTALVNEAIYGAATVTAISGAPQNAVIGRPFAAPLQVIVRDAFGRPVHNVPVTFAAPSAGPGGTFGGSVVVMTNAQGVATSPTFTANSVAGTYVVTASVGGVATPVAFVLTNTPALIVTSPGPGALPLVKVYDAQTQTLRGSFLAYRRSHRGGVRVAVGDVNGDGFLDIITAPGAGAAPLIQVFDGLTGRVLASFLAYPRGMANGGFVAVGNVDGLPGDEIITGPGQGPGAVKVFRGNGQLVRAFFPFGTGFVGGVTVAAGNVRGGPAAEILVGRLTGPAHVAIFDGTGAELLRFRAFADGGVFLAAGDLNGDGRAEIITGSGSGLAPAVRVFDGTNGGLMRAFQPPGAARGIGLRVAASEPGTGHANLVTGAGAGVRPGVEVFNGLTLALLKRFWAYDPVFLGGIFVGGG